ncbi:MAG: toprim domain-containing protein [Gammaproteobacteria bacterium]|nr:toprim domain-containing protein [Gammaproteobacteria bacterium]
MRDSPYTLDERAARAAGAVLQGAELRMPCPVHDSSPETLAIRQGDRAPLWHCHAGCDPVAVRDGLLAAGILVRRHGRHARIEPAPREGRSPPRWIAGAWTSASPLADTPADDYLRSRGLLPPWPGQLRWDARRRRMLARVSLATELRGLHATSVPHRERRTYGPVRGAAVRLAAMDGGVLAVAEGIETALAYAALTGTPAWAALSSAGMKHLELPDGLRWLAVAADFDGPGLLAAEQLERRARDAGIEVRIDLPSRHRTDWADVLGA